jgi:hypothetical protein
MSTETKELLELAAKAMGLRVKGITVNADDAFTGLLVQTGKGQASKDRPALRRTRGF